MRPCSRPVRESWNSGRPLRWRRVNDLPDYVFFNHSIHVAKGIGCASCHGPVAQMPLMYKDQSLYMRWCLECHREPEKQVRPREEIFNTTWAREKLDGASSCEAYHIDKTRLSDCSICHR